MKKIALALLLISLQMQAQQVFNVGLKEGASSSQVLGDTYGGFSKFGFVGGMFMNAKLKGTWSAGFEVFFIQKGSRHRSDYAKGDFNSYFLQLNYVEVPILFKYYIGGASFEFGPGYSFLAKSTELVTIGGIETPGTQTFNSGELNFNLGASYVFSSHFGFNLRYTNSALPIRKVPTVNEKKLYHGGQYNSVFALCLTYEFGKDGSIWKQ